MRVKPITEEELESLIYGSESTEIVVGDDEDNVIDLVSYMAGDNYGR